MQKWRPVYWFEQWYFVNAINRDIYSHFDYFKFHYVDIECVSLFVAHPQKITKTSIQPWSQQPRIQLESA